jgi:glycosyltransferase involved in cell wall biosynthesis
MKKNNIVVITPFYNASSFLERCVSSVITQNYDKFKVIFIDDCSTDNSWDYLPHDNEKSVCIKNDKNVTALPNIHNAIMEYCQPDDICVLIDGDDAFLKKDVLSYVNSFFEEHNCWIMYGQFMFSTGGIGFATAYTEEEFKNIRKAPFKVSHLRSFRAGLYHKIQEQDPNFSCMKDVNNNFYKISYDVAMFAPMLDMCPFEKVKFNSKPLYLYNFENPISDHIKDQKGQTMTHLEIYNKSSFNKIEDYK